MYISMRRLYWDYYICMNACMYVCIMYVCMYVLQSARYSARRSLFGALIGALGGIYVSQVEYACIVNVGIHVYRRADSTRGTIYVCMHSSYVCVMYVCMYVCAPIGAPFGAPIGISDIKLYAM